MAAILSPTLNCSSNLSSSNLSWAQNTCQSHINNKYPKRIRFDTHRISNRPPSLCLSQVHEIQHHGFSPIVNKIEQEPEEDEQVNSVGVSAALSMLNFYRREISPLLPKSCRYVPTCSEYSMIAYKKYGVVKGTVLTAWRLCRCNPLGGSGFDPPRWFDEETPPPE